jgi:hypothetical protein
MKRIPFRVSHHLLAVQPVGWTDFPGIPSPYDGLPWASPIQDEPSPSSRFRSQVSSTSQRFPSRPKLRDLVSCRNHPWVECPQSLTHRRSLASLEAAWLPCSYPPECEDARLETVSTSVSPTPSRARGCMVPPTPLGSLSARRSVLPACPGAPAVESPPTPDFTCFEASLPPASSFPTGLGFPAPEGRSSLGILPL